MRLTELKPCWYRYEPRLTEVQVLRDGIDSLRGNFTDADFETRVEPRAVHIRVETIAEAQGVRFLCPKCFAANGGSVGTHGVLCWSRSRGVPDDARPGPGRWKLDGTSFEDLTLNADPPSWARSVALAGGCAWHGHVTNGDAV